MQRGRRWTGRDAEIISTDMGESNWILQRTKIDKSRGQGG